MGQQQLLLVILSMIIIGIAVAVGVSLFRDSAINSARDAVVTDLNALAGRAQAYYRRPTIIGGGGSSFAGITIGDLTESPRNANGRYLIFSNSASQVVIAGVGVEVVGTDTVEARITVFPDSVSLAIIN